MGGNKENKSSDHPEVNIHDLKEYLCIVGGIGAISVTVYEQSIGAAIGAVVVATAVNTFMEWKTMRKEKKFMDSHRL